ncbi:MAG: PepSY-associated TM helix domain-containing protein [Verrucomicrobia bacterium]|nr:PepSY-associated TM helix domain-containing protein [Verrucomicrobiota bacterium]MDA1067348.1 PepSY-associated TM helix domain-containing protein [Verrucomicrobiota bacterium]
MKPHFHHINRRLHLYLGMFCLPWFIMYGITSIAFNHNSWFNNGNGQAEGEWKETASWQCTVEIPATGEIPKDVTRALLDIAEIDTNAFGGFRQAPNRMIVYLPNFTKMKQLIYHMDEQKLVMQERKKFSQQFLTGMHARGGYGHDSFLNDAWAFVVDVVCSAFVLWVITGMIIWWTIGNMRAWGAVALIGGFLSFGLFMVWL